MYYFQILSCSSTLGNCCSDPSLAVLLNITRKILSLIQLIVPILLIVFAVLGFFKLVNNPDTKNGIKSVINKFLAAAIVFAVPVLVDVALGLMPDSFQLSACWNDAMLIGEIDRAINYDYVPIDKEHKPKTIINQYEYEKGRKKSANSIISGNGSSSGSGSAVGQAIVQYALSFVGQQYVWGGTWNGEQPYTGTDCSGFVQGVYRHFGISLPRTTSEQWADTSKYTVVNSNDIRAGDLIMYDGHVAILTGNGTEIVHAKGSKYGIVIDPDYRSCSSHAIRGIMRIKGVN